MLPDSVDADLPAACLFGSGVLSPQREPIANPAYNGHLEWPLLFQLFIVIAMDINKQLAALTTSELQTAGASQATAIAVSVLLRHLQSPDLSKLLSSAFENHQAVMLQTPWPDQMLQAFEATRRFLDGAAKPLNADDAQGQPSAS